MAGPPITDARRRNMAAIRYKNTTPELAVRSFLHRRGFRFVLHDKRLPGNPDIVLRRYKTVIQVHGCFWHHHGCENSVWPRTRSAFWREKISGNIKRDRKTDRALRSTGWRVITVWECEVRSGDAFPKLARTLRKRKVSRHVKRRDS